MPDKYFVCRHCLHHFIEPLTIGKEGSEAEVCPMCKSDNFTISSVTIPDRPQKHKRTTIMEIKIFKSKIEMSLPTSMNSVSALEKDTYLFIIDKKLYVYENNSRQHVELTHLQPMFVEVNPNLFEEMPIK